ncbi:MAG TPA: molybdopterin oxidoreductase, partial [Polyangia bacterium]
MSDMTLWRGLDDDAPEPTAPETAADKAAAVAAAARGEGQPGPLVQISRRGFLATLGAGSAVGLAACARRPVEKILPFAQRPEDRVPGTSVEYATAMHVGGGVLGLLVESFDGRPIKIEGNPKHPQSLGAASAWAQASIRDLYDNDRSTQPLTGGRAGTWDECFAFADAQLTALGARGGQGLALLLRSTPSPTLLRLLAETRTAYPKVRLYLDDAAFAAHTAAGLRLAGAPAHRPRLHLEQAAVILALDSDLLGTEGDAVRHGKDFAAGRRVHTERDAMNRLYVVEPSPTVTGLSADHRLALPALGI